MTNHSKTVRRTFVAALAATGLLTTAGAAWAQGSWPTKPVTLVVPFAPGGTTDVLARSLGERLSRSLGQPVIIESKPGAGATIGADYVAKARPDGYTLLVGAVHHTIASSVYRNLPYDFQKDFVPLTTIAMVPNVLVVNAATPVRSVAELVAFIKANPDKANFGSNGNGTAQHLIGAQFQNSTGTNITHIAYKGSGPLATDLLGGQILMSFDTVTPVLPHIKAGKLRPLAITTSTRSPALPDVPTLDQSGLKGFDIGTWFGVLAPAQTPRDVVARLQAEMVKVIQSDDFRKRMEEIGADPIGDSGQQMGQRIAMETEKFGKLVREANVKSD